MKNQVKRLLALVCMLTAAALLLLPVLPKVFSGAPKHYRSVHPVSTVAPLMGFGPDSVFNVGTAAEIDVFPGIGEVYSQRIVEGREIFGDYRLPTDLLLVKGIGEKRLAAMMEALKEPLVDISSAWE